jgi:nuclear pore complex protein Nup205
MQQQLQKNGLGSELENVESKNEEYPMTRAFLELLDTLLECNVPFSLGTGTRNHGFEPYLVFIRDSVFLRFNTRAYRFLNEKWKVAEGCLRLFLKLLSGYLPQTSDFALTSSSEVQARHPGFSLMSQLLQTSELLRMLLFIVDEGCQLLDAYVEFPGKKEMENCCLLALKILTKAADLESAFVDCARAANTPILLTPFVQLLMGINPRSGRPDHMLNVCKYVTYSCWLPHHTFSAIKLLSFVAEPSSAHPSLLAVINGNDHIGKIIIKGFTDVLESVEDEKEDLDGLSETLDSNNPLKGPGIREARLAAVHLLLSGLDKPAPSLSHFLLGFDLSRGVSRSALQAPGVLGAVRTPLHALIAVLRPSAPTHPSLAFFRTPQLCEAAYRLLYYLAAHPTTSEPTLRYLRSNEDFLCTQLTLLPLDENLIEPSLAIVKGISWLLKTVAIELKTVCSSRLRSQAANLINLLLQGGVSAVSQHPNDETAGVSLLSAAESSSLAQLSRSLATTTRAEGSEVTAPSAAKQNYRLLQLLDAIDFRKISLAEPTWNIFDGAQLAHVFRSCEVVDRGGERMISIQALHQILNKELVNLPGATAMSHRQSFQQEVKR